MALYVKDNLNHSACPLFDEVVFDCAAWCSIRLSDNERLLVGVVYWSPNSTAENNQKMLDALKIASTASFNYQMVCADFNLPKIDWHRGQCLDTENSYTAELLEEIERFSWFQHSKNHTQFRGIQSSCLDLVFMNEEDMINKIRKLPPVGKSDHACQSWEMITKEVILKNTSMVRPNFKKANWSRIKMDIKDLSLNPDKSASSMMEQVANMIGKTKDTNIPACKPRSIKHRLPWMRCTKIKRQQEKRWRCWVR